MGLLVRESSARKRITCQLLDLAVSIREFDLRDTRGFELRCIRCGRVFLRGSAIGALSFSDFLAGALAHRLGHNPPYPNKGIKQ